MVTGRVCGVDAAAFSERRAALVADATLRGPAFGAAYSALVDEWVRTMLGEEPRLVVVAGGEQRALLALDGGQTAHVERSRREQRIAVVVAVVPPPPSRGMPRRRRGRGREGELGREP